jgi:thiosulfate/3-mercaptopyruvate sulfurtransferase
VDSAWLEQRLVDEDIDIIDTRANPVDRIPGAIPLLPTSLAKTIDGVDGQIMPPDEAQAVLRAAGLRNETTAVVYGEEPEYDPARVVWALHYYQHADVRYLDGGFAQWEADGGEVEDEAPLATASDYAITGTDDSVRVTGDWVEQQLGDAPYEQVAIQIVDARSPEEYAEGHIPSAVNHNWTDNLNAGALLPRAELDAKYADLEPSETLVTYCRSGWRGSFAWLTLRSLGFDDVRVYDGSWLEWGTGGYPVETD